MLERAQRGGALVLGPGLGRADGAFAFARALVARASRCRSSSTPTASTPTRATWRRSRRDGADGAHAARRRARAAARRRLRRGPGAPPGARARRRAAQRRRSSCSRATTRSWPRPSGAVAVSPGGAGALATAGTGDVSRGVLARAPGRGLDPFTRRLRGRAPARAGRAHAAARAPGVDGVIARDVIEALPFAR